MMPDSVVDDQCIMSAKRMESLSIEEVVCSSIYPEILGSLQIPLIIDQCVKVYLQQRHSDILVIYTIWASI